MTRLVSAILDRCSCTTNYSTQNIHYSYILVLGDIAKDDEARLWGDYTSVAQCALGSSRRADFERSTWSNRLRRLCVNFREPAIRLLGHRDFQVGSADGLPSNRKSRHLSLP